MKRRLRYALLLSAVAACAPSLALADTLAGTAAAASPRVLSDADVQLYRDIMSDERAGQFTDAEADIARLSDTSLKGYALAEHYLSERAGRVPVQDLVSWLRNYNELPIADRIYRLAVARSTRRIRRHHHTILVAVVTNIPVPAATPRRRGGGYEDVDLPEAPLDSEAARAALPTIAQYIKTDQPVQAHEVLSSLAGRATALDIARLSHRVAASYLAEGMDIQAFELASGVDDTEKRSVPLLYWDAGFAAYRMGRYHEATSNFETLAASGSVPNWTRSSAAFWAARSYMQQGDPQKVITLLEVAAKAQPTFYGLLAARILGEDTQSGFASPTIDPSDFAQAMENPAAHRAVALLQIGDREDAAQELNRAFGEMDPRYDEIVAALASKMNAPNLELRASESCASRGTLLTGLFPVPDYRPDGGYRVDPSLVLAFARIESRFQTEATSPVGARGLMQLMPATANHVGGPGAAERLYDAQYNLSLGQRYIEELLVQVNGNLVELAAAYNAGPGALTRWMGTKSSAMNDPLLFIESLPVPETRAYVKRMIAYHWMYRRRLGHDEKSLNDMAAGGWPVYQIAEPPAEDEALPALPQQPAVPGNTQVISDARPSS